LKEDVADTSQQLNNLIVEVPMQERAVILKELEEEFSKSLAGFSVNKLQYPHVKELDPKEIVDVSNNIKRQLDANDKFYLHGDYTVLNTL
jgi:hypothetical protein